MLSGSVSLLIYIRVIMNNKYFLILMVFLSSVVLADKRRVVGVVFHDSYCSEIPGAVQSYLVAVRKKGYTVLDLCVPTQTVIRLKQSIGEEAEKQGVKWSEVEGINIIGPVVDTYLARSFSTGLKGKGLVPSGAPLMFDNFSFLYSNGDRYLKDVSSSYMMPSRVRWVSQLFARELSVNKVVDELLQAEKQLASAEGESCGTRFSNELLEGLHMRRAGILDDWSSFPDGIGWNALILISTPVLWYLMGAGREMWGYSRVNRMQTTTDKIMYSLVIYPLGTVVNVYSAYGLLGHLFGRPLPNDASIWKRYILNKNLMVDGLAKPGSCEKNKAP